ncbi:diiron oxygenase [Pseudonocardiaceae bacterium YIM PH 21723]|nr:diiron oxygenase [Pseudonocardiaceae bacterium YIM PH 21723]
MSRSVADREKTAERLLTSSARNSYDPEVDIAWDQPLFEGKWGFPEHRCSLYGTELWQRMPVEQRQALSVQEAVSIATVGIWFEMVVMKVLINRAYEDDYSTGHLRYALTEVADECRHSTMFSMFIQKCGLDDYRPPARVFNAAKRIKLLDDGGPAVFAFILLGEEILDRLQRESMNDESVQPLMRMMNRIHVLEEARHVSFAREEVVRGMATLGRTKTAIARLRIGGAAFAISNILISPKAYAAVGLNQAEAYAAAQSNPHFHQTLRWAGEKIVGFLDENGLVGNPGMRLWRKAHLI